MQARVRSERSRRTTTAYGCRTPCGTHAAHATKRSDARARSGDDYVFGFAAFLPPAFLPPAPRFFATFFGAASLVVSSALPDVSLYIERASESPEGAAAVVSGFGSGGAVFAYADFFGLPPFFEGFVVSTSAVSALFAVSVFSAFAVVFELALSLGAPVAYVPL